MTSLPELIRKVYRMALPGERKVIMTNIAFLSALQVITYILPMIIVPYLFRMIGAEKFGLIAFAQAFIQYFVILTDYGFSVSGTKEISLCRNDQVKISKAFSSIMTVKILLALVSLLVLAACVYYIPKFRSDWRVYIFSFGALIGSVLFPTWFFQGTEKMKYITALNIVAGVLSAVFIFSLVKSQNDYLIVPIAQSASSLAIGLLAQYILSKKFKVSLRPQGYDAIKRQLKSGWHVFISIAAINAYTATRVFILGLLTNNTVTGYYSVAEKIANACQTFPMDSFSQALFPRLSKIYQINRQKAYAIMQKVQQIAMMLSLICLPVIAFFAHDVVRLVCGTRSDETTLSLRLLLIAVFFVTGNAFRVQFLLVSGKTRIYSRIHVVMASVGLPLTVLSIYSFSFVGAALATIILEMSVFSVTYLTVRRFNAPLVR